MDKDKQSPDKIYGPKLVSLFEQLCRAIQEECGASAVRISCEFNFRRDEGNPKGKGFLNLKTFTTPDAKTERMNPGGSIEPRGSKLQRDVMARLEAQARTLSKNREAK